MWVALGLGALSLAAGLQISLHLPRLAASADAGRVAASYLTLRLLAAPIVLAGAAIREARYGFGDSRSVLPAALVSNLLHIPLDDVLIFVARLVTDGGDSSATHGSIRPARLGRA